MGQWGRSGTPTTLVVAADRRALLLGSMPTALTPAQEATDIGVVLTENNGNDVIVTSGNGFCCGVSTSSPAGGRLVRTGP